jgi:hypothetical protein
MNMKSHAHNNHSQHHHQSSLGHAGHWARAGGSQQTGSMPRAGSSAARFSQDAQWHQSLDSRSAKVAQLPGGSTGVGGSAGVPAPVVQQQPVVLPSVQSDIQSVVQAPGQAVQAQAGTTEQEADEMQPLQGQKQEGGHQGKEGEGSSQALPPKGLDVDEQLKVRSDHSAARGSRTRAFQHINGPIDGACLPNAKYSPSKDHLSHTSGKCGYHRAAGDNWTV